MPEKPDGSTLSRTPSSIRAIRRLFKWTFGLADVQA